MIQWEILNWDRREAGSKLYFQKLEGNMSVSATIASGEWYYYGYCGINDYHRTKEQLWKKMAFLKAEAGGSETSSVCLPKHCSKL